MAKGSGQGPTKSRPGRVGTATPPCSWQFPHPQGPQAPYSNLHSPAATSSWSWRRWWPKGPSGSCTHIVTRVLEQCPPHSAQLCVPLKPPPSLKNYMDIRVQVKNKRESAPPPRWQGPATHSVELGRHGALTGGLISCHKIGLQSSFQEDTILCPLST